MKRSLLIRGARQLLTLHGSGSGPRRGEALRELAVIEDGSVLIIDGVIASVGPTRRVENLAEARNAEEINAAAHVVMPAFVDACAGVFGVPGRLLPYRFSGHTSYQAGQGLNTHDLAATINYFRNTNAPALTFQANRHLENFLRHGTATVEARTGFGLNASGEMKLIRVLEALDDKCLSVVPTYSAGHDEGLSSGAARSWVEWLASDLLPRAAERKAVRYVEAACGQHGLSLPDARLLLHSARSLGLPVKVAAAGWPASDAVRLAADADAVSVTGLGELSAEDTARLARTRALAVLLPGCMPECNSTAGPPPGRQMIDVGVPVALGSGFTPSTCSTFSMPCVIALACMRMGLTAEEAIVAATVNAAHSMGVAGRRGSLEFGKDADVCILNVSDYRELPLYFGTNLVSMVIRKGVPVYQSGTVTCVDKLLNV